MLQNVVSAFVSYLVFHFREWRYSFWMREAVAASYWISRRFLCLCCQRWNCCGRRSGGSNRVCVRVVSVPWCMGLASLKNSARFSSNHALSVTLLKQWVHSFYRSSDVWSYSAADSDANLIVPTFNPACVGFDICNWELQRICCGLRSRSLHWSVTTGVIRVYWFSCWVGFCSL
jgi:hypothetical protein